MDKREIIVELGVEGGSISLYRIRTQRRSAFIMGVDDWTPDLLDEEPIHKMSTPVNSWGAAVALLDEYSWQMLFPVFVHPDFQRQTWDALQERFSRTSETSQSTQQKWRRVCGRD
jgi:hypothetical protein